MELRLPFAPFRIVAMFAVCLGMVPAFGQAEDRHLFILSGQSNMNGLDPNASFRPRLEERFGADQIIVVKDSEGGQSIRRWDKGWPAGGDRASIGDLYDRLMAKVRPAIKNHTIRSVTFLWMQGEKDARLSNADVYADSFERLLDQLQGDLGTDSLNVVIGRLSDFGGDHPEYPDWNAMRHVQVELADSRPRARWVNTDDLNDGVNRRGEAIENDLHYSVRGYEEFGRRLADAAIRILEKNDVPYDLVPPANPPHYRVRYQPLVSPGKLPFAAQYTAWVPPGVSTLRGVIVHQHGCGTGSCRSGLTGAFDLHWQALARRHDCALLAPTYEQPVDADCALWCDPRNGSDATFRQALVDLGDASGHPELAAVPWALWGHSGGAFWSGNMMLMHPDRIAAVWLRSGVPLLTPIPDRPDRHPIAMPDTPMDFPVMMNLGTEEGFTVTEGRFAGLWPKVRETFVSLRKRDVLVSVSVDPLTGHGCGEQRYLAIPWFDACLARRLPEVEGQPMKRMPRDSAWFSELSAAPPFETTALPAGQYNGDRVSAVWLPDESVAKAWRQFVQGQPIADATSPPAPVDVRIEDGRLRWKTRADLESGIGYFVVRRNGKVIADVPENRTNSFGRPLAQGLQYSDTPQLPLRKVNSIELPSEPDESGNYTVTAVNTAGLKSAESQAATR